MTTKRSIFEDVPAESSPRGRPQGEGPGPGLIDRGTGRGRRATRIWLFILFAMVVVMIAVGGLTRLTDSGLSITEWRPVSGALPPMSIEAWQVEFDKYRATPEYRLQNQGMSMAEFQFIYWWEWGHRQLGRAIGLVWALGLGLLWATGRIPRDWTGRLLLLGALGGAQGAVGWWMVSSGLEGSMLDVASYRLATHLGLAFVILGVIAWFAFKLGRQSGDLLQARRHGEAKLFGMSTGLMHFAFLQILLGALVAGIDAGRTYTDWPLMAGEFLPPDPLDLAPVWRNFFENEGLVQFLHRMAGYLLFIYGLVVWRRSRSSGNDGTRRAFDMMAGMMVVQVLLGIATVIAAAPWHLGLLHQLGAVTLWVLILRARFLSRYPQRQNLRGKGATA
ncbi:heme A synthase [Brevirhabdus pacifica]|uniref:Heme A synthase n=1 Tax=Brevirhabdus pacifica TaxID=1267768 RepID=A0A1U7DEW6_9RHOB|nr:heme A synthase [Brevirhabdus pacifica]APX88550.1 heme A synthase [Brevirhabdus pacifica]OWU79844.1 heme A synthase [Loktanella sp. 22II-4b]PJJ86964.1 cytochrome c oxidase assembly protein subunit 15 [Brevirhabdus pacifica]